jgi:hypothetical protein
MMATSMLSWHPVTVETCRRTGCGEVVKRVGSWMLLSYYTYKLNSALPSCCRCARCIGACDHVLPSITLTESPAPPLVLTALNSAPRRQLNSSWQHAHHTECTRHPASMAPMLPRCSTKGASNQQTGIATVQLHAHNGLGSVQTYRRNRNRSRIADHLRNTHSVVSVGNTPDPRPSTYLVSGARTQRRDWVTPWPPACAECFNGVLDVC